MFRPVALALSIVVAFAGCGQAQDDPPIANVPNPSGGLNEVLAFWTQIVPGSTDARKPSVEARFVVMAEPLHDPETSPDPLNMAKAACGRVEVAGMAAGAAVASRGVLFGRYREGAPKRYTHGETYVVAVCAVALDPMADTVSLSLVGAKGAMLAVYPNSTPASIPGPGVLGRRHGTGLQAIFIADTGCRGMDGVKGSRFWQDCGDDGISTIGARQDGRGIWPLKPMAANAAVMNPDFVIHGGDHHYFYEGDAYWAQPANTADRFEYWLQEFLNPSQKLLMKSPFVFVRGNHESCETTTNIIDGQKVLTRQWFGDGWFKMFGPPGENKCADRSPTWSFDIAPADDTTVAPFRFYVVDTSEAPDVGDAFDAAADDGVADKAWLSHYPAVKLVYYDPYSGATVPPHVGDRHVLPAITGSVAACQAKGLAGCLPRFMLAGHQHLYQQVDLLDAAGAFLTRMVVAGNGGTVLDYANLPQIDLTTLPEVMVECSYDFALSDPFGQSGTTAVIDTVSRHGFLRLKRDVGAEHGLGWTIDPVWFPMADRPPVDKVPTNGGACAK